MLELEVIHDPAAATVALEPIRSRLLAELNQPASATAVAAKVGLTRQKANYHLNALQAHRLVKEAGQKKWGGLTERLFVASAASYIVAPAAMGLASSDPARTADQLSASYLIALAARIVQEVSDMVRRGHAGDAAFAEESGRRDSMLSALAREGAETWSRDLAREMVAPERRDDARLIDAVAAMFARNATGRLAAHTLAGLNRPDYADLLPRIACPTLVCAGTDDILRPVDGHREMAAQIPGARLVVLDHCGHMLAMERPDAVTATLRDWLAA